MGAGGRKKGRAPDDPTAGALEAARLLSSPSELRGKRGKKKERDICPEIAGKNVLRASRPSVAETNKPGVFPIFSNQKRE